MNKKYSSIHANFSVNYENESTSDDTRFLPIVIDVLHTGENYNGSVFSKEVVDKCIDSIKNTAVLGFIDENSFTNEKDFEGHEYVITKDENGMKRKYLGSAYGVIPESCNPRWVTKTSSDGVEREYLQIDALLWCKFDDAIGIMQRDFEKAQSMELEVSSVEGYEDEETGLFHFTNFRFDGCCLISKEPAMIDSIACINEVQFTVSDFVKDIQQELNDKYNTFAKLVNEQNEQGGIETMPDTEFTTVMEQFNDISNIVSQFETIKDRWGDEIPRYYLVDIQDNEVIVVDRNNNYQYYGFSFTMDGDKPQIDFANGSRKKLSYADYEEGTTAPEGAFDFGEHISKIEEVAFEKVNDAEGKITEANEAKETAETNYSQVKAEYDEMKPKYDEYVKAEQERIDAEVDAQKDAEFAKYSDALADCEEFEALKEKKSEMSLKDIEGECAILYARKTLAQSNFSKSNASVATGIIDNDIDDDNDGYVSTKYGNIPVRR